MAVVAGRAVPGARGSWSVRCLTGRSGLDSLGKVRSRFALCPADVPGLGSIYASSVGRKVVGREVRDLAGASSSSGGRLRR